MDGAATQVVSFAWNLFRKAAVSRLEECDDLRGLLLSEFDVVEGHLKALRKSKLELAVSKARLAVDLLSFGTVDADRIGLECRAGRDAAEEAFGVAADFDDQVLATKVAITCCVADPTLSRDPPLCARYVGHHLRRLHALPAVESALDDAGPGMVSRMLGAARKREAVARCVRDLGDGVLTHFGGGGGLRTGRRFTGAWVDDEKYFKREGHALELEGVCWLDVGVEFEGVPAGCFLPALCMRRMTEGAPLEGIQVQVAVNAEVVCERALEEVVGSWAVGESDWFAMEPVRLQAVCSDVGIRVVNHSDSWKSGIRFEYAWLCRGPELGAGELARLDAILPPLKEKCSVCFAA
ncbi:unnamed protein product [Ostreobium quekettii]|uniref:Uncharacterized protein n=1 Tax=Ostreobium quekettii TaxID=121088 RepID=A0A8S1IV72_9CHLO|nr:unnamed protein product [Ostreobium quekettii]